MSRPITAPRPGAAKDFPLRVHESVAFDLHVYCEALPAQWTKVINRAVRELIDRDLRENDGFRDRFKQLRDRLIDDERRIRQKDTHDRLRLLKNPKAGKPAKGSPNRPKGPANG